MLFRDQNKMAYITDMGKQNNNILSLNQMKIEKNWLNIIF